MRKAQRIRITAAPDNPSRYVIELKTSEFSEPRSGGQLFGRVPK